MSKQEAKKTGLKKRGINCLIRNNDDILYFHKFCLIKILLYLYFRFNKTHLKNLKNKLSKNKDHIFITLDTHPFYTYTF